MRRDGQRAGAASPGLQCRGGGSHLQDLPQSGLYSTVASAIKETVAEENKQRCHHSTFKLRLAWAKGEGCGGGGGGGGSNHPPPPPPPRPSVGYIILVLESGANFV